jgi:hypothetical protein
MGVRNVFILGIGVGVSTIARGLKWRLYKYKLENSKSNRYLLVVWIHLVGFIGLLGDSLFPKKEIKNAYIS